MSSGCAAISLIEFLLMLLIPESPFYQLMKKDSEKARATLKFLLVSDDKVNQELESIRKFLAEVKQVNEMVQSKLTEKKKYFLTDRWRKDTIGRSFPNQGIQTRSTHRSWIHGFSAVWWM